MCTFGYQSKGAAWHYDTLQTRSTTDGRCVARRRSFLLYAPRLDDAFTLLPQTALSHLDTFTSTSSSEQAPLAANTLAFAQNMSRGATSSETLRGAAAVDGFNFNSNQPLPWHVRKDERSIELPQEEQVQVSHYPYHPSHPRIRKSNAGYPSVLRSTGVASCISDSLFGILFCPG